MDTITRSSKAKEHGLLIDYEFCSNCHTCEIACQKTLGLAPGKWGIRILEYGPEQYDDNKWDWIYLPLPTNRCDLCADRTAKGRLPSCVHHCQANVMYYGTLEELSKKLAEKPQQVLFSR